ncbi:hypothetical protein LXL04_006722 [Taraxacum kok-saghyz]
MSLNLLNRGRSRNASSICLVDFSFGGDHLLDRFSVFVLFSVGSVYILCPVVHFESVYKWESVLEIYTDAQTFGLKAASSKAVSNASLAISWLEATFPDLAEQATEGILYYPHSPCTKIQPVWTPGNHPRLSVNPQDRITGVAIICEPQSTDLSVDHNTWLGNSPPLLKLGAVDLALPGKQDSRSLISMCIDPLIPERIYTIHDGGVDSIVLHFLPFTNQKNGKDDDDDVRAPSAQSVMSTWQVESRVAPLCGFVAVSDSFGCCWIVGLTYGFECVVIGMESWNLLLPNVSIDKEKKVGN